MEIAGTIGKIKDFLAKNEQKIVLVVGFCLASAISFGFGAVWGQKWQQKPLVIETPSGTPAGDQTAKCETSGALASSIVSATKTKSSTNVDSTASATNTAGCAFVGSKNSDKFYVPSCSYAKRVKPENLACYKDESEALAKGKTKSDCK